MKYIIEGMGKEDDSDRPSFLIEHDKICYVNQGMSRLLHTRLNVHPFKLSPGKIMHSFSFETATIQEIRKQLSELIRLGCTTVIAMCTLEQAKELQKATAKIRHQLINSTIDYIISVRLPFEQLTPSFIRACRREKIPLIHLKVSTIKQLDSIAWEWIRDALFHYRLVIVPEYCKEKMTKKEILQASVRWKTISETYQIPTTEKRFEEKEPYDRLMLQKIGLYPLKSALMVGSDVDYYLGRFCEKKQEEITEVVVLRGRVIKAGEKIFYSAGFGREVKVKLPGRFQELASSSVKV
ncbi:MAG TPA: hypothetical protein GX525_07080 [Bacilli bacterium]|nr:hypothetical protein [Bacilli bacterium]